jgi:hypothetical protein
MRLRVRIPQVDPMIYQMPEECPWEGCHGKHFKPHQQRCSNLTFVQPEPKPPIMAEKQHFYN